MFTDRALQDAYRALMRNGSGHLDEAAWDRLAAREAGQPERDRLFDHIASCDECARIWRGVLALQEGAEADGLLERQAPARAGWMRSPLVGLAIAATLAIVTGTVLLRTPEPAPTASTTAPPVTSPAPGATYLSAFSITRADIHIAPEEALAPRGTSPISGEPPIERLASALEPYRRGDYAAAVAALTPLRQEFPAAGRPALYLGVALLFLDRNTDAIAPLTAAMASGMAAVAADARWYRAIAYARTGQRAAAGADAKILCEGGGDQAARACNAVKALSATP
jgi:hypothetical protein